MTKIKKATAKPTMSEAELIKRFGKDLDALMEDRAGDESLRRAANEVMAEADRHTNAINEKNRALKKALKGEATVGKRRPNAPSPRAALAGVEQLRASRLAGADAPLASAKRGLTAVTRYVDALEAKNRATAKALRERKQALTKRSK